MNGTIFAHPNKDTQIKIERQGKGGAFALDFTPDDGIEVTVFLSIAQLEKLRTEIYKFLPDTSR